MAPMLPPLRCWRRALLAMLLVMSAPLAARAATYTINITGPIDLGTVAAAASGDTVFRVDAATGAVSVLSGAGRRITAGSARAQVNMMCRPARGGDTACTTRNVTVQIGRLGVLTGRARAMSAYYVAAGTTTIAVAPTGTSPITLQFAPPGDNVLRTFYIGADFPVAGDDSGLPTGAGENAFFAYVIDGAGLQLAGDIDKGKVNALRALTLSKTSDLSFGRIQRPTSGSATVTVAATGARTVTGTAVAFGTPAPSAAGFTIAGEGGQQVSLSIPTSLTLSGPSSLAVSLTTTGVAAPTLSGGLGAAGTYTFAIGGSFTLAPTTPTGAYAGTVTVTVDYN